jgi:23S rRNA (uracil747-C5)-methyltransferase
VKCSYFDAGVCRSCALLETPYAVQLREKQAHVASLLPDVAWEEAVASAESGFRNKAKMVVGGVRGDVTLGILGPDGYGVDLAACGLHTDGIRAALPRMVQALNEAGFTPYRVPDRAGELKHLILTEAPSGDLMARFVLRSPAEIPLIDRGLASVVSVNLQPEHKAILEGPIETVLSEAETLLMEVNGVGLHLRPQSFFQTNTDVAAALYRTAQAWIAEIDIASIWDLYCGVGGFGLHLAAPGRAVIGVEMSEQAIESAKQTASELGLAATTWRTGDATAYALAAPFEPDLVVVNPPRRGIGADLATWLERSSVRYVLYSSCNAESLARDLASMPSLQPARARLLDMFPHTTHHEVAMLLQRG